jgi:hypothetical protein
MRVTAVAMVEAEGMAVGAAKVMEMVVRIMGMVGAKATAATPTMAIKATAAVVERGAGVVARTVEAAEAVRATRGRGQGTTEAEGVPRGVAVMEVVPAGEFLEGPAAQQMPDRVLAEDQPPI